jgi:hypothetical protein
VKRCPETPVNGVPRHHNGAPGSVLAQDIPDWCLTTCRTDVSRDPGLSARPR